MARVGESTLSADGRVVWTLTMTHVGKETCEVGGRLVADLAINSKTVESQALTIAPGKMEPGQTMVLRYEFGHKLVCTGKARVAVTLNGTEWARVAGRTTHLNCPVF